jgi:hypothetical protein
MGLLKKIQAALGNTWESIQSGCIIFALELIKMVPHLEIVVGECWNLSAMWRVLKPVTQVYRKIASCCSTEIPWRDR